MAKSKLVPISVWAKDLVRDKPPHPNTLRAWVHDGRISPQPTRLGRRFYVAEDARYVDPEAEFRERILRGC